MPTVAEIRREKNQETLGIVTFVFLLLTARGAFHLERTFTVPAWGGILLLGFCLGMICVLFYNRTAEKNFWRCMYLSLMPVLAAYLVLGVLLAASLIVVAAAKGFPFISLPLPLLVLFIYYGGPVYLGLATIGFSTASCFGGALAFVAQRANKFFCRAPEPSMALNFASVRRRVARRVKYHGERNALRRKP